MLRGLLCFALARGWEWEETPALNLLLLRARKVAGEVDAEEAFAEAGAAPCEACVTFAYSAWKEAVSSGLCSTNVTALSIPIVSKPPVTHANITCSLQDGIKTYLFPAGIFEISEQLLIPEKTSITGASNPNDMAAPTRTPRWEAQTLFLATRGVSDYRMNYCHAQDMVTTRVGFVLSSFVSVRNISYQGLDVIRPSDNGALCGGGAFETKGCAENNCNASEVNNAGSDGVGSVHVVIENIRLNDYFYAEDAAKVGAPIAGNYQCKTERWLEECCFCKPNGVRGSQVGVWVPQARNPEGTQDLYVNNVVARSAQADAINLHGYVRGALVQNVYFENTGDDMFVLWGAGLGPENVTFKDTVAVNPGILRPNWYGNCAATYGAKSVVFDGLTCKAPTLAHPIPSPANGDVTIDTSLLVVWTSFGAKYPEGNNVTLARWRFEDLQGKIYTPAAGSFKRYEVGKMVWTEVAGTAAPVYLPHQQQKVNLYAFP
ncbi:unnamed protein product [Effrenium voratum]|nr:unnamed protein product [Effrenium voratum]